MQIKVLHILVIFGLILPASAQSHPDKTELFAPAGGKSGYYILVSNDSVGVLASDWGKFSIGTAGGRPLLFGYPHMAQTSHTNFYVDDQIRQNDPDSSDGSPLPAELVEPTRRIGDSLITVWRVSGVEFTQVLVPTYVGDAPQVRIEYRIRNTDDHTHWVGLLLFLDTMIGDNDCAPIATPLGYFESEQEFIGDIPTFWQAFEESPFQPPDRLVGEGILSGWDATPPDVLVYGDFWHYHNVGWDYDFHGGLYSDSAVLLRWNPIPLPAGAEIRRVTYYGIGTTDRTTGEISLSLTYPDEIAPNTCETVSPDSFVVTVFVSSEDTLSGAIASIDPPDFLTVLDDATKSISPATLTPGSIGSASWQVVVNYPVSTQTGTLKVDLTVPGYAPTSIAREISLTAPDGAPPIISPLYAPETLAADTATFRFVIRDESGINPAGISAAIDGAPAETETADTLLLIHTGRLSEGTHTLTIAGISDIYGCAADTFGLNFVVELPPPPEMRIISPPEGSFSACDEDTIRMEIIRGSLSVERSELTVDGTPLPFALAGDTVISFATLGEGPHTVHFVAVNEYGSSSEIEWSFTVDRTPPTLTGPAGALTLRSPADPLEFVLSDDPAGVDESSVRVRVATDSDTAIFSSGSPGITFDGANLTVVLADIGMDFSHSEYLALWIIAQDRATLCGPNIVDSLVLSMEIPRTPPEIVLLEPEGASSCDTLNVVMLIEDDNGINADSAWAEVGSEIYRVGSPELRLAGDTLILSTAAEHLPEGTIPITIGGIKDLWGNEIRAGTSVSVTLDRTPPEILSITPSSDTLTGSESIVFECRDDISGISAERSFVVCNGETLRYGSGMGFDGVHIFVPSAFWLPTLSGDRLEVLAEIYDNISDCTPNRTDTVLSFVVQQSGPAAEIISPPENRVAGCDTQIIKILWYDPDGIERSESWISVNGDTVSAAAPEIVWTGDTVGIAVGGVDTAELILHGVDSLGFDSQDTFVIVFDRQPPVVRCISPSPESSLITMPERMVFVVDDSPAGPNWSTLSLIVNGDLFTAGDESITISGDTVIFNTAAAELPETENLSVAIHISDMAYTCPNATDTSFEFHIVRPEFWWELVAPQGISACESVEVLAVFHANFEIAYDSLMGALGENAVNIAHSGDTAAVLLPGHFLNSGVNTLAVWNIMDTTGRIKIDDTVFVPVLYDASAPSILPIYPSPGENVPAGASVVALVYDDFSGVDRGGVIVEFNGTPHLPEDINWHGDTLVMPLPGNILGEVEVCITASDMPDLCAPHSHRLCWEFNIPGVGPSVQIIEPENGAFTHNPAQKIVAKISAENGIDRSGIVMRINGREYPADSPEISLSGDTLIFTPAANWQDGDTVNFEFILTDNLGLMTETNSYFICDFSPPVCSNPQPEGVVSGDVARITVDIEDHGAGVDPASIVFQVGDLAIPFDNYAVTYDGQTAALDIENAGIHLNYYDTIQVCVLAADRNTGYGVPNIMEGCCFWFMLTGGGCSVSPRTFTPNGDGFNDFTEFKIGETGESVVKIFTLSGALVKQIEGEGIIIWDGTDTNGNPAPAGAYIYTVENGGKNVCSGTIVIAR